MQAMKVIAHKRRRASMVMLQAGVANALSPLNNPGIHTGPVPRTGSFPKNTAARRSPANRSPTVRGGGGMTFAVGRIDEEADPFERGTMAKSLARANELQDQINQLLQAKTAEQGKRVLKSVDSSMGAVYRGAKQRRERLRAGRGGPTAGQSFGQESKSNPGMRRRGGAGSVTESERTTDDWVNQANESSNSIASVRTDVSMDETPMTSTRRRVNRKQVRQRKEVDAKKVEADIRKEKRQVATTFAAFRTRFLGLWLVTNYLYVVRNQRGEGHVSPIDQTVCNTTWHAWTSMLFRAGMWPSRSTLV